MLALSHSDEIVGHSGSRINNKRGSGNKRNPNTENENKERKPTDAHPHVSTFQFVEILWVRVFCRVKIELHLFSLARYAKFI